MGIIGRELGVDFENLTPQDSQALDMLALDAVSDEPVSEKGKEFKAIIEKESADDESEYNKGFKFHTDLNENKIRPATIFLLQLLGQYAEKVVGGTENAEADMLGDFVTKLNDLEFPVDYTDNPFNTIIGLIGKLKREYEGERKHRETEILSLGVGLRHPKYNTLAPHLASLRQLDGAIANLREKFGFTKEDFSK